MEIDLLSDALSMVRLAGAVIFRVDVRGPWCVSSSAKLEDFKQALPPTANQLVALHVLLSGACAILIQRKQEHLVEGTDPINWLLTLLAIIIVPIFLHGLFNAFAKQEHLVGCLVVALASFAWLAWLIRSSRERERSIAATIDERPKVIQTEKGTRWVAPPEPKKSWRQRR